MKQNAIKANPKKAAKAVGEFVASKDAGRRVLQHVYHDKEAGVAVATDGYTIIATKYGFDPNAADNPEYPKWRQVIPADDALTLSATVDPAALAKTCATANRLARAVKTEFAHVQITFGEKPAIFVASNLKRVAEAMAANGITEMRTLAKDGDQPAVAKNGDTTICFMPARMSIDWKPTNGRAHGAMLLFDGLTGRIICAPERNENGKDTHKATKEMLAILKKELAEYKEEEAGAAKNTPLYKVIRQAQKDGLTDPEAAYATISGAGPWNKQTQENRDMFAAFLKTTDADALAAAIADYKMSKRKGPDSLKAREAEIARIEARTAAEDEIDALMGAAKPADGAEAVKAESPAPAPAEKSTPAAAPVKAAKAAPVKKQPAAPAAAKKSAPAAAKSAAADLAAWKPEEWKRLTAKNFHSEVRVQIAAWATANAANERAELAMMAADYAYICNEARDAITPDLVAFRLDLDAELKERITRVYGAEKWGEVRACL